MRTIAVLLVFLSHSIGDQVPGGFVGVDVFFALSGYLITTLLVKEQQAAGRIALGAFYLRRALRLYPALLLTVGLVAALSAAIGLGWRWFGVDVITALTYTYNFWELTGGQPLMGHFWSLSVEEQYYLLWPLLLIWLLRRGPRAALRGTVTAVIATFAIQAALYPVIRGDIYFLPVGHADELLIGSLLGLVLATTPARLIRRVTTSRLAWLGWLPILIVARVGQHIQAPWLYFGGLAGLAVCSCLVIGHLVLGGGSMMSRLLSLRPLVWMGQRSYGFYLFHLPIIELLRHYGLPYRVILPVALIASLVASGLSFRFVEAPILRRFKRPRERAALVPGALGSIP